VRFLGIGESNDLAAMYHGLAQRGHEVRVHVEDPACRDIFGGMLTQTDDWQGELGWLRGAGDEPGIVLFESAGKGELQDTLRRDGFRVIGGSALGDRLEADRAFGQGVLREGGLRTAHSHAFADYQAAIDFVRRHAARYVLKFNGANAERTRSYIGQMRDGADLLALLSLYHDQAGREPSTTPLDFVLMEHLSGIEVGVGAYFNGEAFLDTACIDFEHKHFFPGEMGELTGEMGTIVSYRGSQKLFQAVLAPLAGLLRDGGYCGYINVNLIANEEGLWPLEFTSRFGYPGFAICEALHAEPWEQIFTRMLARDSLALRTRAGFAAGVVLTVPPFPYRHGYAELSKGMPICFMPDMSDEDHAALHFAEVARVGAQLVTAGATGYVGVATGTGATVRGAADNAYRLARKVVVPNLRYRNDIGVRVSARCLATLKRLGWWGDAARGSATEAS
jgi:phosphoribosylamine--glycine ligase